MVGGVCCRVETEGEKHRMYIMTLGCLAPYRRLGVGTFFDDGHVRYGLDPSSNVSGCFPSLCIEYCTYVLHKSCLVGMYCLSARPEGV